MRSLLCCLLLTSTALATTPVPPMTPPTRELHVPYEELHLLLGNGENRILLERAAFEQLQARAKTRAAKQAPQAVVLTDADYHIDAGNDVAHVKGSIGINVLEAGLHAVTLDLSHVMLRQAMLDDQPAPIGHNDAGHLTLFIEGEGPHRLTIEALAPLKTTAARQIVSLRVPVPPATRIGLTIPGDVELRAGTSAIKREHDADSNQTTMQLIPKNELMTIVMSLNSRLKRKERTVVARSVIVNEVTEAFERLHATVSLNVLHQAMRQMQFQLPSRFDVTRVSATQLTRWETETDGDTKTLTATFRDDTTGTVVLNVAASGPAPKTDAWEMAQLVPLDVADYTAVHGVYLDTRLEASSIHASGLIAIDHRVLLPAIPQSVTEADEHASPIRPVAAYYAPKLGGTLSATFTKPPAEFDITGHTLLSITEQGPTAKGSYKVTPYAETLFELRMLPADGWTVRTLTDVAGKAIAFESAAKDKRVLRIRLPHGIKPGDDFAIVFTAEPIAHDWFEEWQTRDVDVPGFPIQGASLDIGAVTVVADSDLDIRPKSIEGAFALDPGEKDKFGLAGAGEGLAFRYERRPFTISLAVKRRNPLITAEAFSFINLTPDTMNVHHEAIFSIQDAGVRSVSISLPPDTPDSVTLLGLNGTQIETHTLRASAQAHVWDIQFVRKHRETAHISIAYPIKMQNDQMAKIVPPLPTVEGVAYQSGMLAIEGDPELDVTVTRHPREVDIGELAEANYQPGRRLLGAYGYLGTPAPVEIKATRREAYALPSAIVQSAQLETRYDASGITLSAATLTLIHKAPALVIGLPESSTLWSVAVNGTPAKPRRLGEAVLITLPAQAHASNVTIVYETPTDALAFLKRIDVLAPDILLANEEGTELTPLPVADLQWSLHLPSDFRVTGSHGSVSPAHAYREPLAATTLLGFLHQLAGGIHPGRGIVAGCRRGLFVGSRYARVAAKEGAVRSISSMDDYENAELQIMEPEPIEELEEITVSDHLMRLDEQRIVNEMVAQPSVVDSRQTAQYFAINGGDPQLTPVIPKPTEFDNVRKHPARKSSGGWSTAGLSSLHIRLDTQGAHNVFNSLGETPHLAVTVVARKQLKTLGKAAALMVVLIGIALTRSTRRRRARYVVGVLAIATLLPVIPGLRSFSGVMNVAFYAAFALVPYYMIAAVGLRIANVTMPGLRRRFVRFAEAFLCLSLALTGTASAADRTLSIDVAPPTHVAVPRDALIIPYTPGDESRDNVLVPYTRFRELWERANPDAVGATNRPPRPYALSGAAYEGTLNSDASLTLEGHMNVTVFDDGFVDIPFRLSNAVLEHADVDGKPARIRTAHVTHEPVQMVQQRAIAQDAVTTLFVKGKGRHRIDLRLRATLSREGGWRVVHSTIPTAPGTKLDLTVVESGTEVFLHDGHHRLVRKTAADDTRIEDSLGPDGQLNLRWRPKVSEGDVEQSLSLVSAALLDIQEDRLGLVWDVTFFFRKGERDTFSLELPQGYRMDRIIGENVRGWEIVPGNDNGPDQLRVELLQSARVKEHFALQMWQPRGVAERDNASILLPTLAVPETIRHTGTLTVRRSPLLDVRATTLGNVRRVDLATTKHVSSLAGTLAESPLGVVPFQTYSFSETPTGVRLEARTPVTRLNVTEQTILRLAELDKRFETRLSMNIAERPIHSLFVALPANVKMETVTAPGQYEWVVTGEGNDRRLGIHFAEGLMGQTAVLLRGKLSVDTGPVRMPVTRFTVMDTESQEGEIAVLADPAFDVTSSERQQIQTAPFSRLSTWLQQGQRTHLRLGLQYKTPDYSGTLLMTSKLPKLDAPELLTHVRVTDRAIEETTLLNFNVRNAGIRTLTFELPAYQRNARISVPKLREKTITEIDDGVRVQLQLQEALLGQIRVLVEHDRLLEGEQHIIQLPRTVTGESARRFLSIENAGRDEITIANTEHATPLLSSQTEWKTLKAYLPGQISHAYTATASDRATRVTFATRARASVATAGARIGLAQTVLMLDGSGGYRASQTYSVDNQTEQFLEIEMPAESRLWAAIVAREYVKPVVTSEDQPGLVRIPLVKTASGDLDYNVVLKYAGRMRVPGMVRGGTFPLIQTRNINVELSQVELRLPKTHNWFGFDGTMRAVDDVGTYAALALSYENKVAQRLLQTAASGNVFEKARALNNLKDVQNSIADQCAAIHLLPSNATISKELSTAQDVLRQADALIGKEGEKTEERDYDGEDNRLSLGNQYTYARNTSDRNVWGDTDEDGLSNWKEDDIANDAKALGNDFFNGRWIGENALLNPDSAQSIAQTGGGGNDDRTKTDAGLGSQSERLKYGSEQLGKVQFRESAGQSSAISALAKNLENRDEQKMAKGKPQSFNKGRRSQKELAWSYQQKLAKDAPDAPVSPQQNTPAEADYFSGNTGMTFGQQIGVGGGAFFGGRQGIPAGLGGLSSLDVNLPSQNATRWSVFRFTTPRGTVEVKARAASTNFLDGFTRLFAAIIVTVVAWLVFLFLSGRSGRQRSTGVKSFFMLACVLALVIGIYPIAAGVLIAISILMSIIRKVRRTA